MFVWTIQQRSACESHALPLHDLLDPRDPFVILKNHIDWSALEATTQPLYSDFGRPCVPARTMIALLIVKFYYNLSDQQTVEAYKQQPTIQNFCGQEDFIHQEPCSASTLSEFRKRLDDPTLNKILEISAMLHDIAALEEDVVFDTTCQEKNITFPTDVKLVTKVILRCLKHAKFYGIKLNNTFREELKEILRTLRFEKGKNKTEQVKKARRRLLTIAGILIRELQRKLTKEQFEEIAENLLMYQKVVDQSKPEKKKTASEKLEEIKELENIINTLIEYAKKYGCVSESKLEHYEEKTEDQKTAYDNSKGRGRESGYSDCKKGMKRTAKYLMKKLEEKLDDNQLEEIKEDLSLFKDILEEKPKEKRIYSLHEPGVACITKGKSGKQHEYGSKASIAITKTSGVIVGAVNFQGNPHDSDTLKETIEHVEQVRSVPVKNAYCDRGYRGAQEKNPETNVHIPSAPTKDTPEEEKQEARKNFGRRSSIEPVIGHLKNDLRLARTFLKGAIGDKISLILACAAYNFKKFVRKKIAEMNKKIPLSQAA